MIDLLDRMLLFPRLFHTGRPCPERACTTNVAAGCGKGDEMFDKILKVIRITGEFMNFYAIVYLEDGIYPSAVTRADFVVGSPLIGFQQSAKLTEVESSVSLLAKGISSLYAYPISTISDDESLKCRHYAEMLKTTRTQFTVRRKADSSTVKARVTKYLH